MQTQLAGETILAEDIQIPGLIIKSAAESVTSSTTLQNDDDFNVDLAVGLWRIELMAFVSGLSSTTLGGISSAWTNTGTMNNLGRACFGLGFGSSDMSTTAGGNQIRSSAHSLATGVGYGGIGGSTMVVHEDLTLEVTVAGTLQWQWAQRVSSGTATNVNTGSKMYVTQVGLI